jgi:GNAT superfamily N-acetyltransferase
LFKIETTAEKDFRNIPSPCRYCLYWQTSDEYDQKRLKPENETEKQEWVRKVIAEFGPSIQTSYLDGEPIGFVQYAPARFFPRTKEYVSEQPSEDAVFIACLYIVKKEARGNGFGSKMLEQLLADLRKRGYKTVETFARKSSAENPSGPLRLYVKHDFKVKNEEDDFPLVRLEL